MIVTVFMLLLSFWSRFVVYEFVADYEQTVGIYQGDFIAIGKLDSEGRFHQSHLRKTGFYSGRFPVGKFLNSPSLAPARVYELRKGMLYLGTVPSSGPFVPASNNLPIRFIDYTYHHSAIPIYNLPGYYRLVPKPSLFGLTSWSKSNSES